MFIPAIMPTGNEGPPITRRQASLHVEARRRWVTHIRVHRRPPGGDRSPVLEGRRQEPQEWATTITPIMTGMSIKTRATAGTNTVTAAGAVSRMIRQLNRSIHNSGRDRPETSGPLLPHGALMAGVEDGAAHIVGMAAADGTAAAVEDGAAAVAGAAVALEAEGLAASAAGSADVDNVNLLRRADLTQLMRTHIWMISVSSFMWKKFRG